MKFLRSQMEESAVIRQEEKEFSLSYRIIMQAFKWCFALIIALFALFFWGCGAKTVTVTEYRQVEVPAKCPIVMPLKPSPEGDIIEINFKILQYAKELEAALRMCK